jgi:hypothetical protein
MNYTLFFVLPLCGMVSCAWANQCGRIPPEPVSERDVKDAMMAYTGEKPIVTIKTAMGSDFF